jgi:hypothetical protein
MRFVLLMILWPLMVLRCLAQREVADESVRYQEERMVYLQWEQNKFTPQGGLPFPEPLLLADLGAVRAELP